MNFLQLTDITDIMLNQDLELLTDGDAANLVHPESKALAYVHSYINTRYDAETALSATGTDRNQTLIMVVADITIYYLMAKITPDNIPTIREERYADAKDWLEKISAGFVVPGLPIKEDTENTTPLRYGSATNRQSNHF